LSNRRSREGQPNDHRNCRNSLHRLQLPPLIAEAYA
jgi:hypothetical protein